MLMSVLYLSLCSYSGLPSLSRWNRWKLNSHYKGRLYQLVRRPFINFIYSREKLMEVSYDDHDSYAPNSGKYWFASSGTGDKGQEVTLNYFADSKEEVAALAHGLGIAHSVSNHKEAEYIGRATDYDEFSS